VFKVTTNGVLTTLAYFNGTNGAFPAAGLTLGNDGNFYGTTVSGSGVAAYGTIFKVTPNGTLTTLVSSFSSTTGIQPRAPLTLGNDGNFYGTTTLGGVGGVGGTVIAMTTNSVLLVIWSFYTLPNYYGEFPSALKLGNDGLIYGTAGGGGSSNDGTMFKIMTNGMLTPFYSFTGGVDGLAPLSLTLGNDGNFYGTTEGGGFGTVFKVTTNGTLTTLVSFNGTNGASPYSAMTLGKDGNFYGTTYYGGQSNNGTMFRLLLNTPLIVNTNGSGMVSPNYNGTSLYVGSTYSMTATAGTGFAFTNWTGGISSPSAVLTNGATLQFVMQSNLVLQANFVDVQNPTNSITSPTPGQSWSNGVFAVTGTASDNVAVSNVFYSLNNAAWTSATTANNWSNWTATVNLIAGTNTVQAYAVDTSGNVSTTNSVSFNAVLSTALTVSTNGLGSITTNYNGQLLIIGKSYSMTAKAATSFVFTNWTGGIGSPQNILTNGLTVNFLMQSNLWLQANFQETSKPTLTVSSPTNNKKLTNALANLIGTTSDNWKVDGVWNQLNDGAWNLASTTNSFTNWTATLTLIAGTNTIKSFAQNWGGLFSTTNNLSVISSNTFKLQLTFTNTLPLKTNGLVFTLQLSTGLVGHIQVSSNLTSWVALTNFTGTNGTLNFLDPAAASSSLRFYRAVIP
jgi:uncharacterized repeat protein (TIGR03803 family)